MKLLVAMKRECEGSGFDFAENVGNIEGVAVLAQGGKRWLVEATPDGAAKLREVAGDRLLIEEEILHTVGEELHDACGDQDEEDEVPRIRTPLASYVYAVSGIVGILAIAAAMLYAWTQAL